MSTTFLPNGIVTREPCPVCQEPDIKVQHGHNDKGRRMHHEHCPRCGDSMPVVCYECHWCDLNPAITQQGGTLIDLNTWGRLESLDVKHKVIRINIYGGKFHRILVRLL